MLAFRCHRRLFPDYSYDFDWRANWILNEPTDSILTEKLCGRLLIHDRNMGHLISEGEESPRNWIVVQDVESVRRKPLNIHLYIAESYRRWLEFEESPTWLIAGESSGPREWKETQRLRLLLYFLEICRSDQTLHI
jgi:hypothetical protein